MGNVKQIGLFLGIMILCVCCTQVFSQGPPPPNPCPTPPCVPIEDHIGFLIAAGFLLVFASVFNHTKKNRLAGKG